MIDGESRLRFVKSCLKYEIQCKKEASVIMNRYRSTSEVGYVRH